jgi:hypothetical protein
LRPSFTSLGLETGAARLPRPPVSRGQAFLLVAFFSDESAESMSTTSAGWSGVVTGFGSSAASESASSGAEPPASSTGAGAVD